MKIHRDNFLNYLRAALYDSRQHDSIFGKDFVSIDTAAIRGTIEAVSNGESIVFFDEEI